LEVSSKFPRERKENPYQDFDFGVLLRD